MAKNKVSEVAWNLTESLRETNQVLVESVTAAQERNMAYAQNTFENGIEVLKSHAESSRNLLREQAEFSQRQQADFQSILNSAIGAQERNIRYAQSIVENGTEVLKSHIEGTRSLLQKLTEQSEKQQELFQELASETVDRYVEFLFTPFSYYKQAIDSAESIARQGVETAQHLTRQGMEVVQRTARQGLKAAETPTN